MKKISLLFISISFIFFACGEKDEVTYENKIKSELAGCASSGCHNAGSQVGELNNYANTVAFFNFGRVFGALNHEANFSPMPKGGAKWSAARIKQLKDWFDAGMPEK